MNIYVASESGMALALCPQEEKERLWYRMKIYLAGGGGDLPGNNHGMSKLILKLGLGRLLSFAEIDHPFTIRKHIFNFLIGLFK